MRLQMAACSLALSRVVRATGLPLANWAPVFTQAPTPDPRLPWHLLAWEAPEPTDWVDPSRGDVAAAGQGSAGAVDGGAAFRARPGSSFRSEPRGGSVRLASGLAG